MANIVALKGQFVYTDQNGVVHEVDAVQGPTGKSAWEYAKQSGLIDDSVTQQDYITACGKVFSELEKIKAANITVGTISNTLAAINKVRGQIEDKFNAMSAATASANNAANLASAQALLAQQRAGEAYNAAQYALSQANVASSAANAAMAATSFSAQVTCIEPNEQPSAFAITHAPQPGTSSAGYTELQFHLPVLSNAIAGDDAGMMLQTGSSMITFPSGSFPTQTLTFPQAFAANPAITYNYAQFSLSNGNSTSYWGDLGIESLTKSDFTVQIKSVAPVQSFQTRIYWMAIGLSQTSHINIIPEEGE